MTDIAILVPVLARPGNARPLVESLRASTDLPHLLLFLCSKGDDAEQFACLELAEEYPGVAVRIVPWEPGPGDFARKIELGYRETSEPWIFQGADDITFTPGWDAALMACAEATGAKVIGTQDGGNPLVKKGRHSTHTLFARSYCDDPGASFDGPGTVFSTAYSHQSTDVELVELAKMRGVWAFCHEARIPHAHPYWHKSQMDATYKRGLAHGREDARLYQQRLKTWRRRPHLTH